MNILYITVRSDFGGGPKHINELLDLSSSEYNIYMASPLGEPYGNLWKNDIRIGCTKYWLVVIEINIYISGT